MGIETQKRIGWGEGGGGGGWVHMWRFLLTLLFKWPLSPQVYSNKVKLWGPIGIHTNYTKNTHIESCDVGSRTHSTQKEKWKKEEDLFDHPKHKNYLVLSSLISPKHTKQQSSKLKKSAKFKCKFNMWPKRKP
jgi:hypothetical protein